MSSFEACRMCLAFDIHLYTIADTPLQVIYERITDIPLKNADGKPVMACYICRHMLKRCQAFIEKSVKADVILQQILNKGLELSGKSIGIIDTTHLSTILTISPVEYSNLAHELEGDTEVPVKQETDLLVIKKEAEVNVEKTEDVSEAEDHEPLPAIDDHISESEDDMPLVMIRGMKTSRKKPKKTKVMKQADEEKDEEGFEKQMKTEESTEIILTKEEQIEDLLARSKSLNYINSPFKCNFCYKGFVDVKAFDNHRERHDERSGAFACEICHMRYATQRHLRTHAATSHGRQFACSRCPHRSHTKNQAREHEKWHNGHKYECQLCGQKFDKPTSYLTHQRKRHAAEHACGECGNTFLGRNGLRLHVARAHAHHKEFDQPTSYLTHQRKRHAAEHACGECGRNGLRLHVARAHAHHKEFDKPTSYLTHQRKRRVREHVPGPERAAAACGEGARASQVSVSHNGLKYGANHACGECGNTFLGRNGMRLHVARAHAHHKTRVKDKEDLDKGTYCAECNISFLSLDAWKRHVLTSNNHAQSGDTSVTCLVCSASVTSSRLRAHVREHDRAEKRTRREPVLQVARLPCDQCGAIFVKRSQLQAHVRRVHQGLKYNKNMVCEICGKKCTSNAALTYHQRTHTGEKPFACAQCPKKFADKNQVRIHLRTHTGERPYCCGVCGKRFSQKPALNRHYRVHTGAKPYECQLCPKTFTQSNSLKLHVNSIHLKLTRMRNDYTKKKPTNDEQPPDL